MPKVKLLVVLLSLFSLIHSPIVEAANHDVKLKLENEYKSPDCYEERAIAINGRTPGPTIHAQQGDSIGIEVTNSLTENITVHWLGIPQFGTPWSNRTVWVIQFSLLPGGTFLNEFVVDQAGTYLYHAHNGRQREAGLYGFIIVSPPGGVSEPFAYDNDTSILLSDSYHSSTNEQATGQPGVRNATNPECSPFVLTVVPGQTYLLRIGNVASQLCLRFKIEGHNMTVVEADGNYVKPFVTRNLYICPGETYSVLVTADQDPSRNYWITANEVAHEPATPIGLAIFNYYPNHPHKYPTTDPTTMGPLRNDTTSWLAQSLALKAREGFPPRTADRVIVDLYTQNKIDDSFTCLPYGHDFVPYCIYKFPKNTTVHATMQNANTTTNIAWHLHGHGVLGFGIGRLGV